MFNDVTFDPIPDAFCNVFFLQSWKHFKGKVQPSVPKAELTTRKENGWIVRCVLLNFLYCATTNISDLFGKTLLPFVGPLITPVLDFRRRPPWVSKLFWIDSRT